MVEPEKPGAYLHNGHTKRPIQSRSVVGVGGKVRVIGLRPPETACWGLLSLWSLAQCRGVWGCPCSLIHSCNYTASPSTPPSLPGRICVIPVAIPRLWPGLCYNSQGLRFVFRSVCHQSRCKRKIGQGREDSRMRRSRHVSPPFPSTWEAGGLPQV